MHRFHFAQLADVRDVRDPGRGYVYPLWFCFIWNGANVREKAFHPSASMKYVDIATGEYKDVPIADFIKMVKANPTTEKRKKEIVSINYEGTAASAKIKIEGSTLIFLDYMNLLKIDGEWKIVSKIFYRINK